MAPGSSSDPSLAGSWPLLVLHSPNVQQGKTYNIYNYSEKHNLGLNLKIAGINQTSKYFESTITV